MLTTNLSQMHFKRQEMVLKLPKKQFEPLVSACRTLSVSGTQYTVHKISASKDMITVKLLIDLHSHKQLLVDVLFLGRYFQLELDKQGG